jgi:3-dehydroquinate synthetase
MDLFNQILGKSKEVDEKFKKISDSELDSLKLSFIVPSFHPRAKILDEYNLSCLRFEEIVNQPIYASSKNIIFIVTRSINKQRFVIDFFNKNHIKPFILESKEDKVKTKDYLDEFIENNQLGLLKDCLLVVIGGGLLLNVGTYIAEKTSSRVVLFPTTILSMADGSGGKVRVNTIAYGRAYKHFYKSFYEPNAMFIDDRFLESLPELQLRIGLVEIIKHGLFQSQDLYDFLLDAGRDLFRDKKKLLKAIFWAADLKRLCALKSM